MERENRKRRKKQTLILLYVLKASLTILVLSINGQTGTTNSRKDFKVGSNNLRPLVSATFPQNRIVVGEQRNQCFLVQKNFVIASLACVVFYRVQRLTIIHSSTDIDQFLVSALQRVCYFYHYF